MQSVPKWNEKRISAGTDPEQPGLTKDSGTRPSPAKKQVLHLSITRFFIAVKDFFFPKHSTDTAHCISAACQSCLTLEGGPLGVELNISLFRNKDDQETRLH